METNTSLAVLVALAEKCPYFCQKYLLAFGIMSDNDVSGHYKNHYHNSFFYPQFFSPFPSTSIFLIEGGLGSKVDGSAQKPRSGHLPRLAHLFYSGTTLPAVSECPCCPGISAKFDKSRKILKF